MGLNKNLINLNKEKINIEKINLTTPEILPSGSVPKHFLSLEVEAMSYQRLLNHVQLCASEGCKVKRGRRIEGAEKRKERKKRKEREKKGKKRKEREKKGKKMQNAI